MGLFEDLSYHWPHVIQLGKFEPGTVYKQSNLTTQLSRYENYAASLCGDE